MCHQVSRHFHGSSAAPKSQPPSSDLQQKDEGKREQKEEEHKSVVVKDDLFDRVAGSTKNKAAFGKAINVFIERDRRRRGHVEFIYAALKKMPEFGVEKDLEIYNRLLDVFPKEVFVPRNYIQRMFNHYPRQQECGVEVLEQMENNGESRPGCKRTRFLKTPEHHASLLILLSR